MKRFDFRLERVRKWRKDQADVEEQRLQQLYGELRAIEVQRLDVESEADRSRRNVLDQPTVTAEELAFMEAFKVYAAEQIRRLNLKQREAELRIEAQRLLVLEAHRSFQLLDGLKDKALVSWTAERDKEQEELAAELYLAKRIRDAGNRQKGLVRLRAEG